MKRIRLFILFSLFLLQAQAACGAVEVTLDALDPTIENANPWFTVRTGYTRHGIHHNQGHTVDMRVAAAGATTNIPVNFFNPIFFYKTSVQLYHPAYISIGGSAEKMPSLLRTVAFGPYVLQSWRSVIDSGRPIVKSGPQIHVQNVIDHIVLFVDNYMPEMDRAGKAVDLARYLPLLRELLAYARSTSADQPYSSKSIEALRQKDPAYAAKLQADIEGRFKLAESYLALAEALLQLPPEQRIALRFRQEHLFKTKVIYNDLMDAADRKTLHDFVELQFTERFPARLPAKSAKGKTTWQNPQSKITFMAGFGETYRMRVGRTDRYIPCVRIGLSADLSTTVPVAIPDLWGQKSKMGNGVIARFCDEEGEKKLQLVGAEAW